MAKIRIYELAKELKKESKELLEFLGNNELKPASGIEDTDAEKVRRHFAPKTSEKKEAPSKVEKETKDTVENKMVNQAAPASASADAEPKKKKPVFLFRPENSSFNNKNSGHGNNKRGGQGQRRQNPNGGRNEGSNRGQQQRRDQGNRPIRPNVPTTAQQYKDYAREEERREPVKPVEKPVRPTETPVVQEVPADKIRKPIVEEPVKETAPVNNAPATNPIELPIEKPVVETKAAPAVKPAVQAEKKDAPAEKTAKQEEKRTPMDSQRAETQRLFEKNTQGQIRNVYREMQEENASRLAAQKERREREAQNGERNNNERGERPYNRNSGDRPYNRNGQNGQNGDRPYNRNSGDRPYNRNGQNGQNGDRPFNRSSGDRPFNRNGQGGQGRDNRGIFGGQSGQGGQNRGGMNVRFNRENSGESASALNAKADIRGSAKKNNNNSHDKARQDRDRTGRSKNAENFKNLSKNNDHSKKPVQRVEEEVIKMIVLPEIITLKDFAEKMKMKPAELIKKLFLQGKMMTLNSELSYEEAEEIALEYDILCEKEVQVDVIEELLKEEDEDEGLMVKRPPVVCVMGHVDHGKTSLLDAIRDTNVTAREAGGITQHIGAYMVECNGEPITFLDTPGHEAFTAMRMRGAQATDIAVLVVAADDGVKPQTVEAINHAKAAGVEIIVAVNKIDKPAANVERVKQELTEYELIAEDWGGSTIFVPVSAKNHENIDQLLEMILLVTEVKELKANPNREMRGIVIEAKLDKGRGPVATVLVQTVSYTHLTLPTKA